MSSSGSKPRAQPRAIVRVSDWPSPIAGAGEPAPGKGSIEAPVNAPQETQSGGAASGRQTAPPTGDSAAPRPAKVKSAPATPEPPASTVRWLCALRPRR